MRHFALVTLVSCCFAYAVHAQVWIQQGPGPNTEGQVENITDREVSGAVNTVAAHPTDRDTIYIGAVNGGIWRTINATGPSPKWVEQLGPDRSLSIGAIAFDPKDPLQLTLAAGSGRFSTFFRAGGDREGVWRTIDGGTIWTRLNGSGRLNGLNISGIAPRGQVIVLSANDADTGAGTPGIWRSADTGVSWDLISGTAGTNLPPGTSFDLASDPTNPARLYTNAGTSGIFRSTDTGAHWTKVSSAAMDALLVIADNVKIAVGNSGEVYVAIASNQLLGLFRSGNGVDIWTLLDLPITREDNNSVAVGIHPGGQAATHFSLAADRSNPKVAYIGGDRQPDTFEFTQGCNCDRISCVCFPNSIGANDYTGRIFRVDASRPSGKQATPITHIDTRTNSAPHADSRDMAVDAAGQLIEADDGGIYRRIDPLTNTGDWESVNGDLQLTELHSIAWDSKTHIVIGGAQDTGTPEQIAQAGVRWRSVDTSDGGDVCVDSTSTPDRSIRYSSVFNLLNFQRREVDTSNIVIARTFPPLLAVTGGGRPSGAFVTPIIVNNVDPKRLVIAAADSVYESFDQGDTVEEIGPGLVVNPPRAIATHALAYGANGNPDILYLGSGDRVFVRDSIGSAPVPSTTYPGSGTGRRVVDIAINRKKADVAFVADSSNVYRTSDGGSSWTNMTGSLMTLTPGQLLAVAFSTSSASGSVVVGAGNGVFVSRGPAFSTWARLGTGLPRVPVFDLAYDPSDEVLVAGLLGRGAWIINMHEGGPNP
jgi:photosystem II stability/assembly factor-like uncharacterized protein